MSALKKFTQPLITAAKGAAMGAADIIPGVSGGTIALISGIYDHLINAISGVSLRHIAAFLLLAVSFSKEKRKRNLKLIREIDWLFLLPLLAGIGAAIMVMSKVIPFFMEAYTFETYAFFFGLIVFSISVPWRMMKHRSAELFILTISALLVWFLLPDNPVENIDIRIRTATGHEYSAVSDGKGKFKIELKENPAAAAERNQIASITLKRDTAEETITRPVPAEKLHLESLGVKTALEQSGKTLKGRIFTPGADNLFLFFIAGALAISAMILPGISGAYILVILGKYQPVLEALHERNFILLLTFAAGMFTGIFFFVRFLKYLLHHYHSLTMAALTGIMIGSLQKIWPFQYLHREPVSADFISASLIAAAGALLILLLEILSKRLSDTDAPVR